MITAPEQASGCLKQQAMLPFLKRVKQEEVEEIAGRGDSDGEGNGAQHTHQHSFVDQARALGCMLSSELEMESHDL